jgi:cytochrome c biogenesis protein CcmG/thiol:disulfide interchange protein DsbE
MRRLFLLAIALTLVGCGARVEPAAAPTADPAGTGDAVIARESRLLDPGSGKLAVGDPAPDFSYTLPDGTTQRLSDLQGKPVVVNFWATWCLPCIEEMPELQGAFADGAGELAVLAVNRNELPDAIARFAPKVNVTFPLIANIDGAIGDRYGVTSLPTTYFIRPDGTIGAMQIGALTAKTLEERLKTIE